MTVTPITTRDDAVRVIDELTEAAQRLVDPSRTKWRSIPLSLRMVMASVMGRAADEMSAYLQVDPHDEVPGVYLACGQCDLVFGEDRTGRVEDACTCYDDALAFLNLLNPKLSGPDTLTSYPCRVFPV